MFSSCYLCFLLYLKLVKNIYFIEFFCIQIDVLNEMKSAHMHQRNRKNNKYIFQQPLHGIIVSYTSKQKNKYSSFCSHYKFLFGSVKLPCHVTYTRALDTFYCMQIGCCFCGDLRCFFLSHMVKRN